MSLSASFKQTLKCASLVASLTIFLAGNKTAFAQPQISVSASFIKSDFTSSSATIVNVEDDTYLITFKLKNTGDLISKDTTVSLMLPIGWEYREASGTVQQITVDTNPYGQVMQFAIPPLGKNQKKEVGVVVKRTEEENKDAIYASISSKFSEPVHSKISLKTQKDETYFISSRIKSGLQYIWLMIRELWSRFLLAIRYT